MNSHQNRKRDVDMGIPELLLMRDLSWILQHIPVVSVDLSDTKVKSGIIQNIWMAIPRDYAGRSNVQKLEYRDIREHLIRIGEGTHPFDNK